MINDRPTRQQGVAALLVLFFIIIGAAGVFLNALNNRQQHLNRDQVTDRALAQAKAALIAYAASSPVSITGTLVNATRPGDLPCPDMDDDGVAGTATNSGCGNGAGTTGQDIRLGRLPWKDLGLPDLRDGSGERLWYAVSSNFKNRTRYGIPLNSDTPGTITIRDSSGSILFDASAGKGVVAVVIAPGAPLVRPTSLTSNAPYSQDRSSGTNQAINYLDLALGEDNAGFSDGSGTDGFISGPVVDSNGKMLANDRMVWITAEELAPYLEKRVAAEVSQCLTIYGASNGLRYPWAAADSLNTMLPLSYADSTNRRLGRVPDTPFSNTAASSGGSMSTNWTGACHINSVSGWWPNWKELVFYAVADKHKPAPTPPTPACGPLSSGATCLTLNGSAKYQYIVLVAGKRLASQVRTTNGDKNTLANYLEGNNNSDDDVFSIVAASSNFNDILRAAP